MTTTLILGGTREQYDDSMGEGERAWENRPNRMSARKAAVAALIVIAAGATYAYKFLDVSTRSGVKAVVALEDEWLQPEGTRGADLSSGLEQFAELGIRRAFVGGDKANQEPVIAPEPDIPSVLFPESDL